jgi:hypothetical protein
MFFGRGKLGQMEVRGGGWTCTLRKGERGGVVRLAGRWGRCMFDR